MRLDTSLGDVLYRLLPVAWRPVAPYRRRSSPMTATSKARPSSPTPPRTRWRMANAHGAATAAVPGVPVVLGAGRVTAAGGGEVGRGCHPDRDGLERSNSQVGQARTAARSPTAPLPSDFHIGVSFPGPRHWQRHNSRTAPRPSATLRTGTNEQGVLVRKPPNKSRTRGGAGLVARGRRPVLGPAHVHLGERLQALRKAAGLTMRDLRPIISQAHLSELENGLVTPSSVLLGHLVATLSGDRREFARLLVAVRTENEERRRNNSRQRGERYVAGLASPLAVTANFVLHGRPEI